MLRKIRLLSLAYLCAENTSVDFSAAATALGVENADVEMWIIDGESWQVVCSVDGSVMAQSLRTSANLPGLISLTSCSFLRSDPRWAGRSEGGPGQPEGARQPVKMH